jgi:hypothetical protein
MRIKLPIIDLVCDEDPKELKGIEGSKLIDTAHQLSKDLSKENTPLIDLIKEDPEYVFKVINSHQSEHNDWALELYLNCIVYSNEGFQQKIANKNYRLIGEINAFINDSRTQKVYLCQFFLYFSLPTLGKYFSGLSFFVQNQR